MLYNLILIPFIFFRRYYKAWRSGLNPIVMFQSERMFRKIYPSEKLKGQMTETELEHAGKLYAHFYKKLLREKIGVDT